MHDAGPEHVAVAQTKREAEFQRLVRLADDVTDDRMLEFFGVIDRDLDRTFPHHMQFKKGRSHGQVRRKMHAFWPWSLLLLIGHRAT